MINYRKKIVLQKSANTGWYLESDRADRYEVLPVTGTQTPWTQWWDKQNQSELRNWQKDIIRDFGSKWSDLNPYLVFKRGGGYSQPHDIVLARSEKFKIWILITEKDFWFQSSDYGQVEFLNEDSMGSVLDKDSRIEMGLLRDALPYDYETS
jgi:hypothetical protein